MKIWNKIVISIKGSSAWDKFVVFVLTPIAVIVGIIYAIGQLH